MPRERLTDEQVAAIPCGGVVRDTVRNKWKTVDGNGREIGFPELEALAAEVQQARALLRDLEWAGTDVFANASCCPCCGKERWEGHSQSCKLALSIGALAV